MENIIYSLLYYIKYIHDKLVSDSCSKLLKINYIITKLFYLDKPISLKIDSKEEFFISFDVALSLSTHSSIVVTIKDMKEQNEVWNLHYICSRTFIFAKVKCTILHL